MRNEQNQIRKSRLICHDVVKHVFAENQMPKQHSLSELLVPGEGPDDLPDVLLAAEEDGAPLVQMLGHQLQDGLPANSKSKSER